MTQPLITRLSKLDAPDREVDARIAAELEPHIFDAPGFTPVRPIPSFRIGSEGNTIRFEDGGIMCLSYFPRYTASVDAVIALAKRVCDPAWIRIDEWYMGEEKPAVAAILLKPTPNETFGGKGANQAIALLIALLRAKEASNGN